MQPWVELGREVTKDGTVLELVRRGADFVIRANGRELMASRTHASEDALAEIGCASLTGPSPQVLVGGLGMGFTLRAALDRLPPAAKVSVVEISEAIIAWNRGPLSALANDPCGDPRVTTLRANVVDVISRAAKRSQLDGILLDVDNGPEPIVTKKNAQLYDEAGLVRSKRALAVGGVLAIWSASEAPDLAKRMEQVGLIVSTHRVGNATATRGKRHVVLLGKRQR